MATQSSKRAGRHSDVIPGLMRGLALGTGVVLVVLTVFTCVDVFMRYVFAKSIPGGIKIGEILLVYAVFPSFGYAMITGAHVRVTLITDRLNPKLRSKAEAIVYFIELLFLLMITYWSGRFFWQSFVQREIGMSDIDIPLWFGKLALPIGILILVVAVADRLVRKVRGRDSGASRETGY